MPVDRVVDDVDLAAHEPLEEGALGIIQNAIPFLEPLQFFGLGGPERLRVRGALRRQRVPILQPRLICDLLGRIQHFALHAVCLAGAGHARISSTWMRFRAILIGIIRFSHEKTGCAGAEPPALTAR